MDILGLNTTLFSTLFFQLNSRHNEKLLQNNIESNSSYSLQNDTFFNILNTSSTLRNNSHWTNSYNLSHFWFNETYEKSLFSTETTSSYESNKNSLSSNLLALNEKNSKDKKKIKTKIKPGRPDLDIPAETYFRPPGALGKNYRDIIPKHMNVLPCLPHCANLSQLHTRAKHKPSFRNKYFNYNYLYNSMQREEQMEKQETEFYAWIFGATMLTLGSLTTLTSCFAFCFCSEKWKKRKKKKKQFDKTGKYLRVDSVSSMVESQTDHRDLYEQLEGVTII